MAEDADVRAEIPALLSVQQQQRNRLLFTPQCHQRWGWRDDGGPKLSPNEVAEFVQTYAWPKETELALQCLFKADYDVPQAVEIMHDARRENVRLKRDEAKRIPKFKFDRAMDRHGKKFHLVKRRMGRNVTTRELVSKFYLWKKTPDYVQWHERQQEKKRKRLSRLQLSADQHREYCETCLKGGKLLCCDGCERAYHLNCVRPALLDVPEGDWFCFHCRDAAPKTPPAAKRENVRTPDLCISKPTSTPKTKANGASLKGDSPVALDIRTIEAESLAAKESPESKPTTLEPRDVVHISDYLSAEDVSPSEGVSDITTESESDGGAAKVFQSLAANCVVTVPAKKRKKQYSKIGTVAGRSRYTSPSRSLEHLSSPLKGAKGVRREIMPLQLESASSSRKRKRRVEAQRDIKHVAAPNEARLD